MEVYQIVLLCMVAFAAGFVDAIVGGGGLIQTPGALVILSMQPVAAVLATVKIPSFCGTSVAAAQYVTKISVRWRLMGLLCVFAFCSAYAGSQLLLYVSNSFMKPVLLVVLLLVAIYTYSKKNFGQQQARTSRPKKELLYAIVISIVVGFYDGFIGPGTGSIFIVLFIAMLGFDFLHASAYAKMVNLATNLGSILLFVLNGTIIWSVALPMAAANALGGLAGARLAIVKGNAFIRVFFLIIVVVTLLRFAYDVFLH